MVISCTSFKLKTRSEVAHKTPQASTPTPIPTQEPLLVVESSDDEQQNPPEEPKASESVTSQSAVPTKAIKIGVILGPGGALTWAHLGVLKELARNKIQPVGIVGVEWASVVAASYAEKGSINQAEWDLGKIHGQDVIKKNLVGKTIDGREFSEISSEWNSIYTNKRIDAAAVSYGCPAINLKTGQVAMYAKGSTLAVLNNCIPYPPLFKPYGGFVSGVREIKMMADFLRTKGADKIILVNVLEHPSKSDRLFANMDWDNQVIWSEISILYQTKHIGVDYLLSVPVDGFNYFDFESSKEILRKGIQNSVTPIKSMLDKLGMN